MPTTNGTVLRINSFPPESEAVRMMTPADSLRVFEGLGIRRLQPSVKVAAIR
jgi:hypothetical protein